MQSAGTSKTAGGGAVRSAADPAELPRAVARAVYADPARCSQVEVRETHISWVFLAGDRAYKLKKPLALDFLDYTTPDRRRRMCDEEVRLNTRLAPRLYRGVCALVRTADGLRITSENDPDAIDYLVEMNRYDERRSLAAAAGRGHVETTRLRELGALLAAYHHECPVRPRRDGATYVTDELERNLRELDPHLRDTGTRHRLLRVARFLRGFLEANASLFDDRLRSGSLREGHGDLRAEHVILAPALSVVDCVEFDPALRTVDVADDLGFLLMDLHARDMETWGRVVLAAYRDGGGDAGPPQLVWFYAAHRALVRAKVALVRGAQLESGPARAASLEHAERLVAVAEHCAWRARGPFALIVCGPPASGKSHLAEQLSSTADIPVLSSDVVRKQIGGLGPHERGPAELYRPRFSARTYGELGRRVTAALADGPGVIVDATFRRRDDRNAFAAARSAACSNCFVECVAPAAVLRARGAARDRDPDRVSDATVEVIERERHMFEPLDEVPAAAHLIVRADRPTRSVLEDLLALLDQRITPVAAGAGGT